ncbi:MAG TPA: hypothetical protein VLI39_07705 [Sedimentisphaerales bacterium]|nr:hypothetical protein [Sedimentisphaerales bacterium]
MVTIKIEIQGEGVSPSAAITQLSEACRDMSWVLAEGKVRPVKIPEVTAADVRAALPGVEAQAPAVEAQAPAATPPKKRGRPAKAKPEAVEAPAAIQTPAAPEPVQKVEAVPVVEVTAADVRAALITLSKTKDGPKRCVEILQAHGAQNVSALDPKSYQAVIEAAKV